MSCLAVPEMLTAAHIMALTFRIFNDVHLDLQITQHNGRTPMATSMINISLSPQSTQNKDIWATMNWVLWNSRQLLMACCLLRRTVDPGHHQAVHAAYGIFSMLVQSSSYLYIFGSKGSTMHICTWSPRVCIIRRRPRSRLLIWHTLSWLSCLAQPRRCGMACCTRLCTVGI